jgi:hypothetical protein
LERKSAGASVLRVRRYALRALTSSGCRGCTPAREFFCRVMRRRYYFSSTSERCSMPTSEARRPWR